MVYHLTHLTNETRLFVKTGLLFTGKEGNSAAGIFTMPV
jgi:hypothetical protein